MSDSTEGFQLKFNDPLPNAKVEQLARILCVQSKVFIRSVEDWDKVPLEAQHQFREYAADIAGILGVDGLKVEDDGTRFGSKHG